LDFFIALSVHLIKLSTSMDESNESQRIIVEDYHPPAFSVMRGTGLVMLFGTVAGVLWIQRKAMEKSNMDKAKRRLKRSLVGLENGERSVERTVAMPVESVDFSPSMVYCDSASSDVSITENDGYMGETETTKVTEFTNTESDCLEMLSAVGSATSSMYFE